jgi:RNA polymerase sigma-70 factor (ECF subfamily)
MSELDLDNSIFDLIANCPNNSREGQKILYNKFNKFIFNICFKVLKNKMESEDLSHDIFIKLLDNINKFKGNNILALTVWVRVFTKNKVIDYLRLKKRMLTNGELNDNNLIDELDLSFLDDENTLANDLKNAISKLSPKYKKVFELYYISDYTHDEIAEELNLNVGTSKSNLFKAKKNLASTLSKYNNKFNNKI